MGFLSKFEGKVEDTFEGAADKVFDAPISPVQIAKKAERQMKREKMVGAGKQYAPTLYTVLVNPEDDQRLFGYYPTLAGETETYLMAKAHEFGFVMDGQPLVRFIVDDGLKRGKFDVIAEAVAAPIIVQLRNEEMQRYGLAPQAPMRPSQPVAPAYGYGAGAVAGAPVGAPADMGVAYGQPSQPAPAPFPPRNSRPVPRQSQPAMPRQSAPYGVGASQPYPPSNSQPFAGNLNNSQPYPQRPSQPTPRYSQPDYQQPIVPTIVPQVPYYDDDLGSMTPTSAQTVVFTDDSDDYDDYDMYDDAAGPMPRLIDLATSQVYPLDSTYLTLGRESSSDIQIQDINASRRHAEITQQPQGAWVITDVGSTNGTLVNGRAIASVVLQPGDYITMGTTEYLFEID